MTGPTNVRIVQVVSDATNGVDVSANGTVALHALQFGDYYPDTQGQYQSVPAAPQLAFTATGATTPFYDRVPSALAANAYATAIAFGRIKSSGVTAATAIVLSDTNANASSGVLVRVVNTIDYVTPGSGTAVDVYIYPQGSPRPATPDISALPWGERSPYVTKMADTLQVDVFTARALSTGTPLCTGQVQTSVGSVRTVVLYDPPAGSPTTTGAVLALYDYK